MNKRRRQETMEVENEFLIAVTHFLTAYGLSDPAARVLALMYLAAGPRIDVTAEDMVRILRLSRATVANALAELEAGGMIIRQTAQGSKRAHYRTFHDAWDFYQGVIQQRRLRAIDQSLSLLRQALQDEKSRKPKEHPVAKRAEAFMQAVERIRKWTDVVTGLTRNEFERYLGMSREEVCKCLRDLEGNPAK